MQSLFLTQGASLTSASPAFEPSGDISFAYGTWLNISSLTLGDWVIAKSNGQEGYYLEYDGVGQHVHCGLGTGVAFVDAEGADGTVPKATWKHVVCRYDGVLDKLDLLVDGTVAATEAIAFHDKSIATFTVGEEPLGVLDETFFATGALSDAAIRRVYACGITGVGCTCNPADPTVFSDCGRLKPGCGNMGPCNAGTPPM